MDRGATSAMPGSVGIAPIFCTFELIKAETGTLAVTAQQFRETALAGPDPVFLRATNLVDYLALRLNQLH